jgi:hypothetical protein
MASAAIPDDGRRKRPAVRHGEGMACELVERTSQDLSHHAVLRIRPFELLQPPEPEVKNARSWPGMSTHQRSTESLEGAFTRASPRWVSRRCARSRGCSLRARVTDDGGAVVLALEERGRQLGERVLAAVMAEPVEAHGGVGLALDEPHHETWPWAEELGTSVTRMTAWSPVGGGRAASLRRRAARRPSCGPYVETAVN